MHHTINPKLFRVKPYIFIGKINDYYDKFNKNNIYRVILLLFL